MFSYAFIFITLTLMILVLASFWLKVPKASLPLLFIYVVFIINNSSSKTVSDEANASVINSSQEKVIVEPEKKIEPSYKEIATIKPKPITFDSNNFQERKTKKVKAETKSEKNITALPKKTEDKSIPTLMVKDIKICKKIYKRTPVGSDVVFTNSVDSLYCYTRIQNTGSKKEVKHINERVTMLESTIAIGSYVILFVFSYLSLDWLLVMTETLINPNPAISSNAISI